METNETIETIEKIRTWLKTNKIWYFDNFKTVLISTDKPDKIIDIDENFEDIIIEPEELIDIDFDIDFYDHYKVENKIVAPDFIVEFLNELKNL